MMALSQKCQYAVRAVYELAKRGDAQPTRIAEIAAAQVIPPRFLETILNQLRQAGFVRSHRGAQGGYTISRPPEQLSVGEIIRSVDGPMAPVRCVMDSEEKDCPMYGGCPFLSMWERARDAVEQVYDQTTFADLLAEEATVARRGSSDFSI
jgi:Rrf2 family cysteine metabolism transcriptional repressor